MYPYSVIREYASNEGRVKALKVNGHEDMFPILFDSLKKRFYPEVKKKSLWKISGNILSGVLNFVDSSDLVIQVILNYLKDQKLTALN